MPIVLPLTPDDGAWTLTTLRAFVRARGFDYLTDTTLDQLIGDAARELTLEDDWRWRRFSDSGPSPLEILELGHVEYVLATGYSNRSLQPIRRGELMLMHPEPSQISAPMHYIIEGDEVLTYPTGSAIEVAFFTSYVWNAGGVEPDSASDSPIAPTEWHELIGQLAVARAHLINKDQDGYQQHLAEYMRRKEQMVFHEQTRDGDEPETVGFSEAW